MNNFAESAVELVKNLPLANDGPVRVCHVAVKFRTIARSRAQSVAAYAMASVLSNRKRPFHLFTDGKLGRTMLYLARFCPILVEAYQL